MGKLEEAMLTKNQGGMGFKDLERFNDALLGKQVWRLLTNPNSLFYKVFKARYFPHCLVMDDEVQFGGSYAWQSIFEARTVIALGFTWRTGNGTNVLIKGDKWLPDPHSRTSQVTHGFVL